MADNLLVAQDAFAGNALAAGWTAWPTSALPAVVAGPLIQPTAASAGDGMYWTGNSFPNDQICELTLHNLSSTGGDAQCDLCVRFSPNVAGHPQCYQLTIDASLGHATIFRVSGGSATQVAQASVSIAANDVWAFGVFGSVLVAYKNGTRQLYTTDTNFASGTIAVFLQANTTAATSVQVSSIRMYSAVQKDGVWTKQGCVLPANSTELANSPSGLAGLSTITFGPSLFLTIGNSCYRSYYGTGNSVNYAESLDGLTWTRYSSNPVIASGADSILFNYQGTWYAIVQVTQGVTVPVLYTSTDGLTFTSQGNTNLPSTGYPCGIVDVIGGSFYLHFGKLDGTNSGPNTYLYTAPIGTPLTWTVANGGSPTIPGAFPGAVVAKIGGAYYLWSTSNQPGQGNATASNFDPCEAVRWRSADLIHWTLDSKSLHASQMSDSLNNTNAGVAVNCVIDIGGQAHMYYQGSPGDSTGPADYQPMLAIAPVSMVQLVTQPETAQQQVAADNFTRSAGGLGSNWTTPTGTSPLQIISSGVVEPSVANVDNVALYTGAGVIGSAQYSSVTVLALNGATGGQQLIAPLVLGQTGANSSYQVTWQTATGTQTTTALFRIIKKVAGTPTNLITFSKPTLSVGDVITLASWVGSDGNIILTAYQNGFQLMQVEDYGNTFTSGYPGVYQFSVSTLANSQVSAWSGGNTQVIPNFLGLLLAKLPILVNGIVNNGPLSGGYESSFDYHINSNGTVATSSTKSGSAYLSSMGWLRNPTGEIVINNSKLAGAQIGECGVLINPDGSAVVTTTQTNPYINSGGLLVNQDGSMIVNNGST